MKILNSQWPIMVFVLMFVVLPFATIPGWFDPIFTILGIFTVVIIGLIIASLVTAQSKAAKGE